LANEQRQRQVNQLQSEILKQKSNQMNITRKHQQQVLKEGRKTVDND